VLPITNLGLGGLFLRLALALAFFSGTIFSGLSPPPGLWISLMCLWKLCSFSKVQSEVDIHIYPSNNNYSEIRSDSSILHLGSWDHQIPSHNSHTCTPLLRTNVTSHEHGNSLFG
jgi:hypothetical protein